MKNAKKKEIVLQKDKNSKDYTPISFDPNMMNKFILYVLPVMI